MPRLVPLALCAMLLCGCGGTVKEDPQPELTIVDATVLDFGNTLAGTSRARQVILGNKASDGAGIEPLENIVIGINGTGLTVSHDCPATLLSGARCTLEVLAAPIVAGPLAGTLAISSNAKGSPLTLPVSGTAVGALDPAQAAFSWQTGSSGEFGAVASGGERSRGIVVVNRGNAPGAVRIGITPAGASWSVTDDCTGNRAGGSTCTATVRFAPTAAGAAQAWLELTDDYHQGYARPRLALRGTGT